jgi:MFS transporter, DHA2 family, multidrug resistance protein
VSATGATAPGAGAALMASRSGIVTALTLTAVVLAMVLEMIDITIVNVALPNIQGNLGVDIDQATFIITGYIIANVVVVPLTPWLQARFGTRNYFAGSIALFTFASAMCGLSNSLEALVFWRIVQGVGGGGLISTSQTILRSLFPPTKQGSAQAFFAAGTLVGPTAGPILGGWITENLSWQWCFYVNVPLGILAVILCFALLPNERARIAGKLDVVGVVLLIVGLGSLQYVLDQGERKDWFDDTGIVLLTATAVIGLSAFVAWVLTHKDPVVDLRVLRFRGVSTGSLIAAVLGLALFGSVLIIPQYTQVLLGFTPLGSGQVLSTRAVAMIFSLPIGVILSKKMDPRYQMAIGIGLLGLSTLMLANVTTSNTMAASLYPALALSGLALANIFLPLQLAIFNGLGQTDVPKAAAFFSLSRQLGGGLATAILVTLLDHSPAGYQSVLAGGASLASQPVATLYRSEGPARAAQMLSNLVNRESQALGYEAVTRISAYITLIMIPLPFLIKRQKGQPAELTH